MRRILNRIRFIFKFHKSIPFIKDFFFSKEVKTATKVLFAVFIVGYIAFPFDIIPDFLLLFGIIDDVTIAVFLLQQMVKVAPDSLKRKYNF